eukprot:scaffold14902_cov63-Phaeocystis_antarctica.AAC.5
MHYLSRSLAPLRAACWQARAILHFDCVVAGWCCRAPVYLNAEAPTEGLASDDARAGGIAVPRTASRVAAWPLFARHGENGVTVFRHTL